MPMLGGRRHPIFSEFREKVFEFDLTICYPPGAGGNFLLNLLDKKEHGEQIRWTASNEFSHDLAVLNLMDFFDPLGTDWCDKMEDEINVAYDIAIKDRLMHDYLECQGLRILRGHRLPLMFEKVFSYHTDELMIITVKPEHYWFVKALRQYKLTMARKWDTAAVIDAINSYHRSGINTRLEFQDFLSTRTYIAESGVFRFEDRENQIFFDYFLWLKGKGLIADLGNFSDFMHETMFSGQQYIDYEMVLGMMPRCYDRLTVVDYHDLFIGLRLPIGGLMSNIDINDLATYRDRNVDIPNH